MLTRYLPGTAILVLLTAAPCLAQAPQVAGGLMLPGSLSAAVGTFAPSEPGNVVFDMTAEQGLTAWRRGSTFVVGFLDLTLRTDSDGYVWNSARPIRTGLKLSRTSDRAVGQVVVGLSVDRQIAVQAPLVYGAYWRGWRGERDGRARGLEGFPGSLSATSGIVTAREPRNWTSNVVLEQGTVAFRVKGVAAIPYVRASGGADTQGHPWNNRMNADVGAKVSVPILRGVFEAGIARRFEIIRTTGQRTSAPVVFAALWLGWNPRLLVH